MNLLKKVRDTFYGSDQHKTSGGQNGNDQEKEETPVQHTIIDPISNEAESILASIVHSSDDAIISKSLEGIVTSWNDSAQRIFGYTAQEMIGQSITKLIPPDRLDEEPRILEKLKKGERVDHFETIRITKYGEIRNISLSISPIRDGKGRIIGASKIARDITNQKIAERLIRDNEERFRMAVESTGLGTFEFFPQSGKINCSNECLKIFGVSAEEILDSRFLEKYVHPDDKKMAGDQVAKATVPGSDGNYKIQYRIIRENDHQVRWVRAQGKVFFDSQKRPERFIGTVLDITEEQNKEQQLRDSIELFTMMADNMPVMIWMSGNDKFNDYFNNTWLEFTGRTMEQESQDGWLEGVHPEDVKICIEKYNQSLAEQKGVYSEYRLRRYDGQYRWIADNSVARYKPDGSFAGFISACMDIDDQKRFQELILESELMLKTISSVSPVALWMTDSDIQNIFVNDTWIEWTGLPLEKQKGTGWLAALYEKDKKSIYEKFSQVLPNREKYRIEFRIKDKNGHLRWCYCEGSPYFDLNGDFAGYAGSITDISEIKKLEERKDDFIKMASHELKTPVTSIKGYVQLLQVIFEEINEEKFESAKPTIKTSLKTISKQVSRLTRLVSELLDLSRIDSGKLELRKTEFDPGDLVEEIVADIRLTTSRHAIIIHNDFEGRIIADKDRIGQVLLNLLTNAVKYSPDADSVEISVNQVKDNLRISVRDHGIGIDREDQSRVFERFYRVEGKSEQTYPGFGIGLFIASEIMQRHAGTISVESRKGSGSVFTIQLPIRDVQN